MNAAQRPIILGCLFAMIGLAAGAARLHLLGGVLFGIAVLLLLVGVGHLIYDLWREDNG